MELVLGVAFVGAAVLVGIGFLAFYHPGPNLSPPGVHRATKTKPATQRPGPLHGLDPMGPRLPEPRWHAGEHRREDLDPGEEPEVYPR